MNIRGLFSIILNFFACVKFFVGTVRNNFPIDISVARFFYRAEIEFFRLLDLLIFRSRFGVADSLEHLFKVGNLIQHLFGEFCLLAYGHLYQEDMTNILLKIT